MKTKIFQYAIVIALLCMATGCAKETPPTNEGIASAGGDISIMSDETFAQIAIDLHVAENGIPDSRNAALALWSALEQDTRDLILEKMEDAFSGGAAGFSVTFSDLSYHFTPDAEDSASLLLKVNTDDAGWIIAYEELTAVTSP